MIMRGGAPSLRALSIEVRSSKLKLFHHFDSSHRGTMCAPIRSGRYRCACREMLLRLHLQAAAKTLTTLHLLRSKEGPQEVPLPPRVVQKERKQFLASSKKAVWSKMMQSKPRRLWLEKEHDSGGLPIKRRRKPVDRCRHRVGQGAGRRQLRSSDQKYRFRKRRRRQTQAQPSLNKLMLHLSKMASHCRRVWPSQQPQSQGLKSR